MAMTRPTRFADAIFTDPLAVFERDWLVQTEANDSVSSTAKILIQANGNITEAGDTLSATTKVDIKATLSNTEAADTLFGTTKIFIKGTLSAIEGNDTLFGLTKAIIKGTLTATEQQDGISALATIPTVRGSLIGQEVGDTLFAFTFKFPYGGNNETTHGLPFSSTTGNTSLPYSINTEINNDKPYEEY